MKRTNLVYESNSGYHSIQLLFFCSLLFFTSVGQAQVLQAQTTIPLKIGGYHISCYGGNDGSVELQLNNGIPPYQVIWDNGMTGSYIQALTAGTYTGVITDAAGNSTTVSATLLQPQPLSFEISTSNFNGYQTSGADAWDGNIEVIPIGGTPPYSLLWQTGDSTMSLKNLQSGLYTFTITDANNCVKSGSTQLTAPTPIAVSVTQTASVSCFGASDGKAAIIITGGLGNYTVQWDNGSFSFSPENLKGGLRSVKVYEQGRFVNEYTVMIDEPAPLALSYQKSSYPNGYQVSCSDCYNGTIDAQVTGGVPPYNYLWNDYNQTTTAHVENLGEGIYTFMVTDQNGCALKELTDLKGPEAKLWSRNGNDLSATGISDAFIGTTDSTSLMFKVNNEMVMKISKNQATLNVPLVLTNTDTLSHWNNETNLLAIDSAGKIRRIILGDMLPVPITAEAECADCNCSPIIGWGTPSAMINGNVIPNNTNDIVKCPAEGNVGIGLVPQANTKLDISGEIAIDGQRLHVDYNGRVGIGTGAPSERFHLHGGNLKVTCPWDIQHPVFFVDYAHKNVGIGTGAPLGKFDVKTGETDHITIGNMRHEATGYGTSYLGFNIHRSDSGMWYTRGDGNNSGAATIYSNAIGDMLFATINGENQPEGIGVSDVQMKTNSSLILTNDGRMGLGVNPRANNDLLGYRLLVNGNIKCKRLRVEMQSWADDVFDVSYSLRSLKEVEDIILAEHHLPDMPASESILADGADLGNILTLQQRKIEELTLYLIAMQKELEQLKH